MSGLVLHEQTTEHNEVPLALVERQVGQLATNAIDAYPGLEVLADREIRSRQDDLSNALMDSGNRERVGYSNHVDSTSNQHWLTARVNLSGSIAELVDGSQPGTDDPVEAIIQVDKNGNQTLLVGNRSLLDLVVDGITPRDGARHQSGVDKLTGKMFVPATIMTLQGKGYADSSGAILHLDGKRSGGYAQNFTIAVDEATKGGASPVYPATKRVKQLTQDPVLRDQLIADILHAATDSINGEPAQDGVNWQAVLQTISAESPKQAVTALAEVNEARGEEMGQPFGNQFIYNQHEARMLTPELALVLESCGISDQNGVHIEAVSDTKTGFVELIVTPSEWTYSKLQLKVVQTQVVGSDYNVECVPFPTPTAQATMADHAKLLASDIQHNDVLAGTVYAQLAGHLVEAQKLALATQSETPELPDFMGEEV